MSIEGVTGDQVKEAGTYVNTYGKKVSLNEGDNFPACPKEGKSIKWEKTKHKNIFQG